MCWNEGRRWSSRFDSPHNQQTAAVAAVIKLTFTWHLCIFIFTQKTTALCGRFIQNTMSERGRGVLSKVYSEYSFQYNNEPASYFYINIRIPRLLDGLGLGLDTEGLFAALVSANCQSEWNGWNVCGTVKKNWQSCVYVSGLQW